MLEVSCDLLANVQGRGSAMAAAGGCDYQQSSAAVNSMNYNNSLSNKKWLLAPQCYDCYDRNQLLYDSI